MLKGVVLLAIGLLHASYASGQHEKKIAKCAFGNNQGEMRFIKTQSEARIRVRFYVHRLRHANTDYKVHIHEFASTNVLKPCDGLGHHFNPDDNDDNNDLGNLGIFQSNQNRMLHDRTSVDEFLTLTSDSERGIIGRGVAIHGPDGTKELCCTIVEYAEEDRMGRGGRHMGDGGRHMGDGGNHVGDGGRHIGDGGHHVGDGGHVHRP